MRRACCCIMATTKFNMVLRRVTPETRVVYYSTILPFGGYVRETSQGLITRVQYIQRQWRACAAALRNSGWHPMTTKKFGYARNCPPVGVYCDPPQQPCLLRVCPFCHARKVLELFRKIRTVLHKQTEAVKVVSLRIFYGHAPNQRMPVVYDADGTLDKSHFDQVLRRHVLFRIQMRYALRDAIGGAHWYTLAPFVYRRTFRDGSCGRWHSMNSCVAIMPEDWEVTAPRLMYCRQTPNDFALAKLVGHAFRYRAECLTLASAPVLADMLNATRAIKQLSTFGELRCE